MFTDPQTQGDTPKKFMFERSFDPGAGARPPERKPVTLKPDQVDALKKESYDSGFAAGKKAGFDEQTAQAAALTAQMIAKLENIMAQAAAVFQANEANVRRVAMAIAQKFVPDLVARNGLNEIDALLASTIGEMIHEPRLVVRVNETQFDIVNEKINAIVAQKAYTGKIVVLADAEVRGGDCRIEWADGGIERNSEELMQSLEKTVTPPTLTP